MTQKPPAHYPVTGVCIVSDPQKCPLGYDIVCIVLFVSLEVSVHVLLVASTQEITEFLVCTVCCFYLVWLLVV